MYKQSETFVESLDVYDQAKKSVVEGSYSQFDIEDHKNGNKSTKKLHAFRQKTREKIESILNLRTFLVIAIISLFLGLYVYNVTSIKRLGENIKEKKEVHENLEATITEKELKLKEIKRSGYISYQAYEKLNLRYRSQMPIVIKE